MFVAKLSPEGLPVGVYGVARKIGAAKRSEPLKTIDDHRYPSPAMKKTLEEARLVAEMGPVVLLTGETGSGKDWLAQYIHEHSPRSSGPYYQINCGAIQGEIAESELFGHEKGAFTGASARKHKRGLLELANCGTLLLNEIGDLPLLQQVKLLTFLDTLKFTRVGGETEVTIDARLIAATNRDLAEQMEHGRFREDLFHRLNVFQIEMPPLRERREDIPKLIHEIIGKLCIDLQFPSPPSISRRTIETLKTYHWPGNVRELRNVLERALIIGKGVSLDIPDLGIQGRTNLSDSRSGESPQRDLSLSGTVAASPWVKSAKLKKPTPEQCAMIYEKCLKDGQYTRADLAKVFGRESSSTVSKWFPQKAGYTKGQEGRPSGSERDLKELRLLIEEIMN